MSRPCCRSRRSSQGQERRLTLAPDRQSRTALILTGGGARAGYQAGVLKAIREILLPGRPNPFPILCGTSAGAINAASLAVFAEDFDAGGGESAAGLGELQRPSGVSCRPRGHRPLRCALAVDAGRRLAHPPRAAFACSTTRPAATIEERPRLRPHRTRDRKRRPAFVQHYLFRLFLGPERELFPGTRRPRRLAPQPAGRRAGTDHARPPDGVERDPLHFSRPCISIASGSATARCARSRRCRRRSTSAPTASW
jgi:hypothetical protein